MDLFKIDEQYDLLEPLDEYGLIDGLCYSAMLDQVINKSGISNPDKFCIDIAALIKNIQAEETMIEKAIDDMEGRVDSLTQKRYFLQNYLKRKLESLGIEKITSCPYFVIRICKNPPAIDINDPTLVPKEYFITKEPVVVPNKKLMKEEIEQGVIIPGVKLVQNTRLEIK